MVYNLKITNLQAKVVNGETILNGVNLEIPAGEVHAIMGQNGTGKSTLASVLAGNPNYEVTEGVATLNGEDLLELEPFERANAGLFLAFQYPAELPGVNAAQFLRTSLNAQRKANGKEELNGAEFLKLARTKLSELKIDHAFLKRDVNSGFSGGEKKQFEILQMSLLEPSLIVLDEIDSGLDIDALKTVAKGVNSLRNSKRSFLIITHYQRLLDYIKPDAVHIIAGGKIVKSGDSSLAEQLEKHGYDGVMA